MTEEHASAQANHAAVRPDMAVLGSASREKADSWLEEQTLLARLQIADMRREDELRHWNLRLTNLSQVMKVAFEIAVAFIVLAVAAVVAGALWSAHESDGLVIEAFQVPPSLAEQGLSGQVLASRIQDKLSAMQGQTDSIRAPSSYQNNWGNDIKVEIPNTGVSIGEFNRYLRAWLGNETHITGEVWKTGDSVFVVARAGADAGKVFSGKESELDALLQKAAEAVYAKTQPYRYAVYLSEQNRTPESLAVLKELAVTASAREQAWAYLDWGLETFYGSPDWREGHRLVEIAVARDPGNADTLNTLSALDSALDREQANYDESRRAIRLFERSRNDLNPAPAETSRLTLMADVAEMEGDFRAAAAINARIAERPDFSGSVALAALNRIYDLGGQHDAAAAAAEERKAATRQQGGKLDPLFLSFDSMQSSYLLEDWAAVNRDWDLLAKPGAVSKDLAFGLALTTGRQIAAYHALALAGTGDFRGAEEAIRPTPGDCDTCLIVRGRIAAAERQWDRAAYWFARADAQAPSLPMPDLAWGRMLLAKGDAVGAVAKFKAAHAKGPNFADPLEFWGEALIAQNRSDLALAKFEAAGRLAPNWARLHRKWGVALAYLGRKDEAAKQFALARSLDG